MKCDSNRTRNADLHSDVHARVGTFFESYGMARVSTVIWIHCKYIMYVFAIRMNHLAARQHRQIFAETEFFGPVVSVFLPGKNVSRPSIAPTTLAIQHAGKESNTQEWQSTDAAFRGHHCKRPVSAFIALPVIGLLKSRTSERKRGLIPKF